MPSSPLMSDLRGNGLSSDARKVLSNLFRHLRVIVAELARTVSFYPIMR
jgi:hypothetical protein